MLLKLCSGFKIGLTFQLDFSALEISAFPLRYSNYPLTNKSHAKVVDALFTTDLEPRLGLEAFEFYPTLHSGALETGGTCTYIVNPIFIKNDQPQCPPELLACSHLSVNVVFAAGESGRCQFKYGPCPPSYGQSSKSIGYTQFNCNENPDASRTCITTSLFPLTSC